MPHLLLLGLTVDFLRKPNKLVSEPTWTVKGFEPKLVAHLEHSLGLLRPTAKCLYHRGITTVEDAEKWLNPKLADLERPEGMTDLSKAVSRVADAIVRKERIGVFGDYDVDGITSASVVSQFLNSVGAATYTKIADRFLGYGLRPESVDDFVSKECTLILAVDLGTGDYSAADRARTLNTDLIVIDHHRVEGEFPEVFSFINPKRKDCDFLDKTLAAVGLSFYFAAAVRTELCNRGVIRKDDLEMRELLDLVALGTVADVVALRGNNRILVSHGLRYLSETSRIGLRKLIRISKIRSSRIRSEHIAFQLAPRLNAAGRIGKAEDAYHLLVENNPEKAEIMALHLDKLSTERRRLENEVLHAARQNLLDSFDSSSPIVFAAGDGWHRGVIGIVASRLMEETGKPAFIMGFENDNEEGTGSVRGRGRFNVYDALSYASDYLVRFGGHKDAAGFTVKKNSLRGLQECLCSYASKVDMFVDDGILECDDTLRANEIDPALVAEIEKLGPFGAGNPEPLFDIDGLYVLDQKVVGGDHLKLQLKTPSGHIFAFGPRMAGLAGKVPPLIRAAAHVVFDEWRGNGEPELRLAAPPVEGS